MQWIFVGAGNMASSLIGGLISAGNPPSSIQVVDPDSSTLARAVERFKVNTASSIGEALDQNAEEAGVVLAVKPHIVEVVCRHKSFAATTKACCLSSGWCSLFQHANLARLNTDCALHAKYPSLTRTWRYSSICNR